MTRGRTGGGGVMMMIWYGAVGCQGTGTGTMSSSCQRCLGPVGVRTAA